MSSRKIAAEIHFIYIAYFWRVIYIDAFIVGVHILYFFLLLDFPVVDVSFNTVDPFVCVCVCVCVRERDRVWEEGMGMGLLASFFRQVDHEGIMQALEML